MKIVDIGKCVDNVDPKGLGRIRVQRYNDLTGPKEKINDFLKIIYDQTVI